MRHFKPHMSLYKPNVHIIFFRKINSFTTQYPSFIFSTFTDPTLRFVDNYMLKCFFKRRFKVSFRPQSQCKHDYYGTHFQYLSCISNATVTHRHLADLLFYSWIGSLVFVVKLDHTVVTAICDSLCNKNFADRCL